MGSVEQPVPVPVRPLQVYSKRQKKKFPDVSRKEEILIALEVANVDFGQDITRGGGTDDKLVPEGEPEEKHSKEKTAAVELPPEDEADKEATRSDSPQKYRQSGEESDGHRNSKMSRLVEVATSEFHNEELLRESGDTTATGGLRGYQRRRKRQEVAEISPRKKLDTGKSRESPSDLMAAGAAKGSGDENDAAGGGEDEYVVEEEDVEEDEEEEDGDEDEDEDEEEVVEKRKPRRSNRYKRYREDPGTTTKRRPGRPRKTKPPPPPPPSPPPPPPLSSSRMRNPGGKESCEDQGDAEDKSSEKYQQVYRWLRDLELEKYADCFEKHEVEDDVLPLLTLDDLREMGIAAVGARRKMFTSIQEMELLPSGRKRR